MKAAERAANLIEMLAGRQQLSVNPTDEYINLPLELQDHVREQLIEHGFDNALCLPKQNCMVFPLVRCNGTGTVLQIIDGVPFLAYVIDEGDKKKTIRFTRAKKYQVRSVGW